LDYDNDGWLDLVILNGAVKRLEALARQGDRYPLDQPNQLFRNVDGKRFVEVSPGWTGVWRGRSEPWRRRW
jgi:hypothetical protein